MIPAPRLIAALLAWAGLGAAAGLWPVLRLPCLGAAALLLLAAALDAWLAARIAAPEVQRQVAGVWPVGVWNQVTLSLHNRGARPLRLTVYDGYPTAWDMQGLPHAGSIAAAGVLTLTYRLRPPERGQASFSAAHLRLVSPLGLWHSLRRAGPQQDVKVFPDFSALLGHSLSATARQSPVSGAIRKRRRGEGTDFRQLRDYRQGDSLRAIDWKASARRQRPISREYQEERDQQVVFLLDTGRRMLARERTGNDFDGAQHDGIQQDGTMQEDAHHNGGAGTSHFDHALNAVLTLAYVAQKQGDAVGLMTFGGGAGARWLAPHKGRTGLDRLLAGVYDLQPDETAPDYALAASDLLGRLRKRAFVVLITNLRDEDDQAVRSACDLLASRHLVLCASLRESALDRAAAAPVATLAEALRHSAAALYLQQREQAMARLGLRAGRLLDITPDRLGMALLARYQDIKDSGQL